MTPRHDLDDDFDPDDHPRRTAVLERPVTTQAGLRELWLTLVHPLGFATARLYVLLLDEADVATKVLVEVGELPARPEPAGLASLAGSLAHVCPGGRFVAMLGRPGPDRVTADDRAWGLALGEAWRAAGLVADLVHVAGDADVVPLPWEELTVRSA